jgi:dTDP-4-dehydrorhamnose 3,5-epimerase
MEIEDAEIEGLYIVHGLNFPDLRGSLIKPFSKSFFEKKSSLNLNFKETWFTKSHTGVIRAMHLQVGEFSCEKLISVIQGAVLDVVLDIRKDSKTYGQWLDFELSEENPISLYIPKGCAHGYKVLKEKSITMYMATEVNIPKDEMGIRWDSFGYDWKIENPIISERDKNLPLFKYSI